MTTPHPPRRTGAVPFDPTWLDRSDPFGVLYRPFGRGAGVTVERPASRDVAVALRLPWVGRQRPVPGSQVLLVVVGHVVAVVAAHRVAVARYPTPTAARRGHLPLVVLMVGWRNCYKIRDC